MINNYHGGSGTQNNYNANHQTINYGGHHVGVGGIFHIEGDMVNFNLASALHSGYKALWEKIKDVGASHSSEQQYSRGECLEGTRVELQRAVHEWAQAGGNGTPFFWLTGAAGVGKTAIAITVAKACEEKGLLGSSFIFFRHDPKRNNPQSLFLTIAHDLYLTMPFVRTFIEERISEDPRVLEATLELQFQELILNPILRPTSQRSSSESSVPKIVIIDGLDECSDESTQLRILSIIRDAVQQAPYFPLRFLICSRPEAWIQEAFSAKPLRELTVTILLDNDLTSFQDIMRYCRHHFQEIASNPKYNHVQFPNPWPSEPELWTLVHSSCRQFVYAAIVVRFITLGDNHPIDQLRLILKGVPPSQLGVSPFHEIDMLYQTILQASPNPKRVHTILSAIIILPGYLYPTPAYIEWLLGLSPGQVALTLRGMHSVLKIGGWGDVISLYHTSFRDYLLNRNRSRDFHIDLPTQRQFIAERWLRQLTTGKIEAYSLDQLWSNETKPFFTRWMSFCSSLPEPTWNLLVHLRNVDLSFVFLSSADIKDSGLRPQDKRLEAPLPVLLPEWYETFDTCHRSILTWGKGTSRLNYRDRAQVSVMFESLSFRLSTPPKIFHLDLSSDVRLDDNVVRRTILLTAQCQWDTPLVREVLKDNGGGMPRLRITDCTCDYTAGRQPNNPKHLRYQDACVRLLRDLISEFQRLSWSNTMWDNDDLHRVFLNVVNSSLLQHCRLDSELLSLCRSFFDSAQNCRSFRDGYWFSRSENVASLEPKLLEWIRTFPADLTAEGRALQTQIRDLPWSEWCKTYG